MPIISGGSGGGGTALGSVTTVTGTPAVGEVIAATSGTAAAWAVPLISASTLGDNSGNFTTTSATFTDLTGASVSIAAAAGDKLLYIFQGSFSQSLATVTCQYRLVTVTGANSLVADNNSGSIAGDFYKMMLATVYTVVSGDISGGNVNTKVQVASDGTHTLTIHNAGNRWQLLVVNLRQ